MILTHTINGFFIKKKWPKFTRFLFLKTNAFVLENSQKSNFIKNEVIMRGVSIAKLHSQRKGYLKSPDFYIMSQLVA